MSAGATIRKVNEAVAGAVHFLRYPAHSPRPTWETGVSHRLRLLIRCGAVLLGVAMSGCTSTRLVSSFQAKELERTAPLSKTDREAVSRALRGDRRFKSKYQVRFARYGNWDHGVVDPNRIEVDLRESEDASGRRGLFVLLWKRNAVWEVEEQVRTFEGVWLGDGIPFETAAGVLEAIRGPVNIDREYLAAQDEEWNLVTTRLRRIRAGYHVECIDTFGKDGWLAEQDPRPPTLPNRIDCVVLTCNPREWSVRQWLYLRGAGLDWDIVGIYEEGAIF